MGRSSVSGLTVTVFGGSGHVGRHLVNRLGRIGTQVVVPFRGDEYDVLSLRVMGDLGRIHLNVRTLAMNGGQERGKGAVMCTHLLTH